MVVYQSPKKEHCEYHQHHTYLIKRAHDSGLELV